MHEVRDVVVALDDLVGPCEGFVDITFVSLDLARLTFLDSSGLNTFADYGRSLNGQGPLVLANVPAAIAEVLDIVGFDELETIEIRR